MMKYLTTIFCSFLFVSSLAHADENAFDKAKHGAETLWQKTKETSVEIADTTSEKMSEFGKKASEFGGKASEKTKETGTVVWDKMKDAGEATAEAARIGASKIRSFVGQEKCDEDSALCFKDKE